MSSSTKPPKPKSYALNDPSVLLKTFVAGGVAGSLAKTIVAPIDRVKILVQAHSTHYQGVRIFSTFWHIWKREGIRALYKGNGAQILRIFPYAAFQFASYEMYKHLIQPGNSFLASVLCGSLAGITAVTATYPLDVIRSRLAFQFSGQHMYNGIIDCIKKIYAEQGSVTSFYRGYTVTILGMIPYAGLSFSIFERAKHFVIHRHISRLVAVQPGSDNRYELTVLGKLACGGITGLLAQTATYPMDVVRRHMQLSIMLHSNKKERINMSILETLKYVYNKYGLYRGLYRGISLNYVRAVPMVSTSFCSYELSKKFLGLDTSIVKIG